MSPLSLLMPSSQLAPLPFNSNPDRDITIKWCHGHHLKGTNGDCHRRQWQQPLVPMVMRCIIGAMANELNGTPLNAFAFCDHGSSFVPFFVAIGNDVANGEMSNLLWQFCQKLLSFIFKKIIHYLLTDCRWMVAEWISCLDKRYLTNVNLTSYMMFYCHVIMKIRVAYIEMPSYVIIPRGGVQVRKLRSYPKIFKFSLINVSIFSIFSLIPKFTKNSHL